MNSKRSTGISELQSPPKYYDLEAAHTRTLNDQTSFMAENVCEKERRRSWSKNKVDVGLHEEQDDFKKRTRKKIMLKMEEEKIA